MGPVTAVVLDLGKANVQPFQQHVIITPGQALHGKERWVYSASWDKTIRKWNPETMECVVFHGHDDLVKSLLLLDETTLISGAGDGTIRVWDTTTGKCTKLMSAEARSVDTLAPSVSFKGEKLVWAGSSDGHLRLWNIDTGLQVTSIRGHETNVTSIKTLFNAWYQHGLNTIVYPLGEEDAEERRDVENDAIWMVAASLDKSSRRFAPDVSKAGGWKEEIALNHDDFARTVALVPGANYMDAHMIATGGRDEDVHLWTSEGELIVKIPGHCDEISQIGVISVKHMPERAKQPMSDLIEVSQNQRVSVSSNHSVLVTSSLDGTIRFWPLDVASLELYRQASESFATLQPQKDDAFLKKLESCLTDEEERELHDLMSD
jgi:WD40 repeat protein